MTTLRLVSFGAVALILTGCASTAPRNDYQAYLRSLEAQNAQQQIALAQLADANACNGDPTCVVAAKGFAAMALAGSGRNTNVAAPQRELSGFEKAATLIGAVTPLAGVVAGVYNTRYTTDASLRSNEAMWNGLGGIVGSLANREPGTIITNTTTVGGNFGDTRGDTAGGDIVGGDQFQGPVAGGDIIGGDQIIARRVNSDGDDRDNSPGPFSEEPVVVVPPVVVIPPVFGPEPPEEGERGRNGTTPNNCLVDPSVLFGPIRPECRR
jgi:hypothetical protein